MHAPLVLLRRCAIAFALVFAIVAPAAAAPTFPPLTGRVVDDAHILSDSAKASLTEKLEDLENRTSRQLVVVTLPSLQGYEIEDYGYQLGRAWGIGQKKLNNGVLFIIAPNERKVRIEVGYGLEPILTDALSNVILQERVLPKFRKGDMEAGIVDGTDAIVEQLLLDAPAAKARVAEAEKQSSQPQFNPIILIFIAFIIFSIFGRIFGGRRRGMGALPWIILGSGMGRGGSWGGGGFGGGGFSGGGGSFGGGGSSGSW
ncbi:MAG TPA: TPM domain-containing protein [Rhizomicrobium sp.]|nr:TPM domain-containing protein [Rhizomicrobium sp.]